MRLNMKNTNGKKKRGMAVVLSVALGISMFSFAESGSSALAAEHISELKKADVEDSTGEELTEDKDIVFDALNEDGEYTAAVNEHGSLSVINYENSDDSIESIRWSVSDESIIQVEDTNDFKATYKALSPGRVNVYFDVIFKKDYDDEWNDTYEDDSSYWDRYTFSLCVYPDMSGVEVLNPNQTRYITNYDYNTQFTFKLKSDILLDENDPDAGFEVKSSNSSMDVSASLNENVVSVWAYRTGQTKITFKIYGREFEVNIKVVEIGINKNTLLIVKGKSTKIKVKGVSDGIKWSSTKKSIAKVNSNGKIKGSRVGTAVIVANVNGTKLGCAVSVVSAKTYNVIKKARSVAKGKYSQPKRMQKGYYDCSSLVWRAYSRYGTYFGARNYAPVAADICKWCWSSKKKRISSSLKESQIQNMKLRAGDLVFKTGVKNGRFKGIYHVEMFAGYSCSGFDSKGKPVLNTVWANRTDGYYAYGSVVARP